MNVYLDIKNLTSPRGTPVSLLSAPKIEKITTPAMMDVMKSREDITVAVT